MMRSLYAAISGLRVHQQLLDVTANNIANVNTIGYKSARATFKDALLQTLKGAAAPVASGLGGTNPVQIGLGVQLGSIDNVVTQGAIQTTGGPFDLAIQGKGWFQVSTDPASSSAPVYYTRAGNFTRDANGNLVNPDGYYLVGSLNNANSKITVPADARSVSIDPSGTVTVVDASGQTTTYTIQLAAFPNDAGLERVGNNLWQASPNSGTATVGNPQSSGLGSITPGAIEMSNVDLALEFTTMIAAQRGFQANSRVISTGDEMLQELVNLRR
ncbi:MAG: flagellar basal body rod protein FlgG [Acidimicrobiia bacterium]